MQRLQLWATVVPAKKTEYNMATILNPDLLNRVVASTTALNSSGTRLNATTDPRSTTYAPPNASAAVAVTNETFSGLVNALNAYQARLVKQKNTNIPISM